MTVRKAKPGNLQSSRLSKAGEVRGYEFVTVIGESGALMDHAGSFRGARVHLYGEGITFRLLLCLTPGELRTEMMDGS